MRRRALLTAALSIPPAFAQAQGAVPVLVEQGLAIAGHDPVAYFNETRAIPGHPDIAAMHEGATYRFVTSANRDAFLAEPARYLPQYGGYCAYGMARGYKAVVDPTAFTIAGGRLYLNYNATIAALWQRNRAREIARADARWPEVRSSPDVAR